MSDNESSVNFNSFGLSHTLLKVPREKSHNFIRQPSKRKGIVKARRNRNRSLSRCKTTH